LEASIRLRDDFLAVAGHELKTPLTALLMQIQSLRRAIQKDPHTRVAERLEKAANAGLRLERLIDQLLDVSRITAGRLRLEPEALNLADLVEDVAARFVDASIKQNDSIVVSCEPVVGRWDRLRLEQVVNNLVANALKYGGESPVEISLHQDQDSAVLEVVDRGIGIDEAHQQKIFQRFERAVAARDFGGLGLGLWITRQIIEASGGSIEVESEPGRGSTFTVRLPLNADRAAIEVQ
jgi:signal transduction histidine kinase